MEMGGKNGDAKSYIIIIVFLIIKSTARVTDKPSISIVSILLLLF